MLHNSASIPERTTIRRISHAPIPPSKKRPGKATQAEMLLMLLRARRAEGKPVELPEIRHLGIYQYTPRFFELRERGHVIENEMHRNVDGSMRSFYWLCHDSELDVVQ